MIQWKSWAERIVNEEIKNRGKESVLADIMHYGCIKSPNIAEKYYSPSNLTIFGGPIVDRLEKLFLAWHNSDKKESLIKSIDSDIQKLLDSGIEPGSNEEILEHMKLEEKSIKVNLQKLKSEIKDLTERNTKQ